MKIDTLESWSLTDLFEKVGLQFEVVDASEVINDNFINEVRLQLGVEAFDYLEEDLMCERSIECYKANNRLFIHTPTLGDTNLVVF